MLWVAHTWVCHVTQQVVWYENLTGKGSEWKRHVIYGPFNQAFDAVAGDLTAMGILTWWRLLGAIGDRLPGLRIQKERIGSGSTTR